MASANWSCRLCDLKDDDPEVVINHGKAIHGVTWFSCPENECFALVQQLVKHVTDKHVNGNRHCPFPCNSTTKFSSGSGLRNHVNFFHAEKMGWRKLNEGSTSQSPVRGDVLKELVKRLGEPPCDRVIYDDFYVVGWSDKEKGPKWIFYTTSEHSLTENVEKSTDRIIDKRFPSSRQLPNKALKSTNLEWGHLLPRASMRSSAEAQAVCDSSLVMVPQNSKVNVGSWSVLENQERTVAKNVDLLYVFNHVIYDNSSKILRSGQNVFLATGFIKALTAVINDTPIFSQFYCCDNSTDDDYDPFMIFDNFLTFDQAKDLINFDLYSGITRPQFSWDMYNDELHEYLCHYGRCCYRTFNRNDMFNHRLEHNIYKCNHTDCDKKFYNKKDLDQHKNVHTGAKPFKCPRCDSSFGQSNNLREHVKVVHDNLKTFFCPYCDKSFGRKQNRDGHVNTHTGDKPYICVICGERFSDGSNRSRHVKEIHEGIKRGVTRKCKDDNSQPKLTRFFKKQ